jgi:hypothetical protein
MSELVANYGRDSYEVSLQRVANERQAYEIALAAANYTDTQRDNLMLAWDAARGIASVERERLAAYQQELDAQTRSAEMAALILQYGSDSYVVAAQRAANEREAYEAAAIAAGYTEIQRDNLMDAWDAANGIASVNMAGNIALALDPASKLASKLWEAAKAWNAARSFYGRADPNQGPSFERGGRMGSTSAPYVEPPATLDELLDNNSVGGSSVGSGGGGPARDAMAELRAQIALEREMLDLTKDQQRVYSALGDERSKYSQIELDALAAEIKSLEDKKKTIADMQSISNTVQSSMSDAFMSMVDGTMEVEDAFRNMSRAIIAQLYQVMVVQRVVGQYDAATKTGTGLAGSLMKLISSATVPAAAQAQGGAWSGGSQVMAYANGGIVTTPTMFDMSGGRRGLMGEAGPEAILPLSRASNGKLGVAVSGGGTNAVSEHVNISNVFNVTGSDAETVRREINKALPRISEVTKASVLDARRRGGKMLATFG